MQTNLYGKPVVFIDVPGVNVLGRTQVDYAV